jgi:hypothetical protein
VKYGDGVDEELLAAASWYEALAPGAGERFLAEVHGLIEQIETFPAAGFLVRPGLRQRLVPHFPYVVLYTADPAATAVIAVAHTSRREGYWLERWEVREPVIAYGRLAA